MVFYLKIWGRMQGSNPRPPPYKGGALPTELIRHMAGRFGFEPKLLALEARALPLNYRPMRIRQDLNLRQTA